MLIVTGNARLAMAAITVAPISLNFGTVVAPGDADGTFKVTNSGDLTLSYAIGGPGAGSLFGWAPTPVPSPTLDPGETSAKIPVTFTVVGATAQLADTITVTPSLGQAQSVELSGAGCVGAGVLAPPMAAGPLVFDPVEQGFRRVRSLEVSNTGNSDVAFSLRIAPSVGSELFSIIRIGEDITLQRSQLAVALLPTNRCGPGPTGPGSERFGIVFHATSPPNADPVTADLEIVDTATGAVSTYPLSATVIPAVPVDAVLVIDRSGSMSNTLGGRDKLDAARAAGQMFAQLLRDDVGDRLSLVTYATNPTDDVAIGPASTKKADVAAALNNLSAGGSTNIAGGLILGDQEFNDPPHPSDPPGLKRVMVALTDGQENRCFQRDGAGDYYSLSGQQHFDVSDVMRSTSAYLPPAGVSVYAVGLGEPANINTAALDAISSATDGYYSNVDDLSGLDFFQLEKYFTQIFMDAVGMAVASDPFYEIAAGVKHEHEFDILPGDVNAMVVLYDRPGRLPFFLETPKGEIIDGLSLPEGFGLRFNSSPTARFAEVTFPTDQPERIVGRWKVTIAHDGQVCVGDLGDARRRRPTREATRRKHYLERAHPGFVPKKCKKSGKSTQYGIAIGVGSNLRMQPFVDPAQKRIGEPIGLNAVISEAGLAVEGAKVEVSVTTPFGSEYQLELVDGSTPGEYENEFAKTAEAGTYAITFRASGVRAGRPWQREAVRTKTVIDPRTKPKDPDDDKHWPKKDLASQIDDRLLHILKQLDQFKP